MNRTRFVGVISFVFMLIAFIAVVSSGGIVMSAFEFGGITESSKYIFFSVPAFSFISIILGTIASVINDNRKLAIVSIILSILILFTFYFGLLYIISKLSWYSG